MQPHELEALRAYKISAREFAEAEARDQFIAFGAPVVSVAEIDQAAITAYENWHNDQYDFGFERVIGWKRRASHARAIDIAVWCGEALAGLCWASPQDSHDKILVLYLQRNPEDDLPTRGHIAPICLSAVRNYALLLELEWVVIKDPIPEARDAYIAEGFRQVPGVGLAYDLTDDYAVLNEQGDEDEH